MFNIRLRTLSVISTLFLFLSFKSLASTTRVNGIDWTYYTTYSFELEKTIAIIYAGSRQAAIPTYTSGAIVVPSKIAGYTVTRIREDAFIHCNRLTSVEIPDSVTSIGDNAFSGCTGLTSIEIPDSVTSIGDNAFSDCTGLTSIEIPSSVTKINCATFKGCSSLTSIIIPDSITSIESAAFSGCSNLVSITLPKELPEISIRMFEGCCSLKSITIPYGVSVIDDLAFRDCSSLTEIYIPSNVKEVNNYVFENCVNLEHVVIGSGARIGRILDPFYSFLNCGKLKSFDVSAYNPYYTSLNGFLLSKDGKNLRVGIGGDAEVPAGVETISTGAFRDRSGLTSIKMPDGLKIIGGDAFRNCIGLTSVSIPDSVTDISSSSFAGCSNLVSLVLGCSVSEIGYGAFTNCTSLSSIEIPDSVTYIGWNAFDNCHSSLYDFVTIPGLILVDGWIVGASGNPIIEGKLNLAGVRGIASKAFSKCDKITELIIPNSINAISGSAFNGATNLVSVTVPGRFRCLSQYPFITNAVISEGSTSITNSAFSGCENIRSVTIPNSVTNIGDSAFASCKKLLSIVIPDSIKIIGACAFDDCAALKEVIIPDSVTDIGAQAFYYCKSLETIKIPCSVTNIEDYTFAKCSRLHTAYLPNECEIAENAFPSTCNIVRYRNYEVIVESTYGTPIPNVGTHIIPSYELPTNIACSVFGEIMDVAPNTRFHCIGWSGTGSVPALGAKTNLVFSIEEDSSLTWLWQKECFLDISTSGSSVGTIEPWMKTSVPWSATSPADSGFKSGAISPGEISFIETTIVGTGTLSFKWRISAGRGDFCKFYLDGVEQASITRSTDWMTVTLDIPAGEHTLRWSYERGSGAASGEDAAFLDDVDWRPEVSFSVASLFGETTPIKGAHTLVYGDGVAASVVEPAATDGTRRICTGWTGTGSVPASGTGTNVAFTIKEDSSLTWNWRTDNWTDVSVSGGTCDFTPQWVADGTQVAVEIVPVTHLYTISLFGDTQGVTLDGTTLRFAADRPRNIAVTVDEVKVSLTVESEWGVPSPTNGVHALSWGMEVVASVQEPEPIGGYQYLCTGWTGSGDVPASGTGTNMAFMIEGDSSLAWNWRTNVLVSLALDGPMSADFDTAWVEQGSNVVVRLSTSASFYTLDMSGDTDGVEFDEANMTLAIPADSPRSVSLVCTELSLAGTLDAQGLIWTVDGDADWFPQVAVSSDGEDAAKSGCVIGSECSGLETTVSGAGTFSWSWRLDSAAGGNCGVDVLLDGIWLDSYAPDAAWSHETIEIEGVGEHTIRFEFWNTGTAGHIDDCAYLDCVSWTPNSPLPPLALGAAPSAVTNAIESAGFADSVAVQAAIGGDSAKYSEFKEWAQGVPGGEAAVISSTNAAVSWLLGAEALFVNEPTITIAEMSIADNDGSAGNGDVVPPDGAAFTLAVTVKDGEDAAMVSAEKVAQMFEATSDLRDWDGKAKLATHVSNPTRDADGTLHFTITPGDGTEKSAFLRIKVKP